MKRVRVASLTSYIFCLVLCFLLAFVLLLCIFPLLYSNRSFSIIMGVSGRTLLPVAIFISVVLNRYAPAYTASNSIIGTAAALFVLLQLSWTSYTVLVYPRFVSPLRHLPQAPVCLSTSYTGKMGSYLSLTGR